MIKHMQQPATGSEWDVSRVEDGDGAGIRTLRAVILLVMATLVACSRPPQQVSPGAYADKRAPWRTELIFEGPSPQPYEDEPLPANVESVLYPSGDLMLKGWLWRPIDGKQPLPAIVFLHGGFAFSTEDFEQARPFRDAGYVVFFPMLRGENGNDGNFELLFGEVEDALAAAKWLGQRSEVDKSRIAMFGHSIGGATAELAALWPGQEIWISGSVGALYPKAAFESWAEFVPFDLRSQLEIDLRSFTSNMGSLQRTHFAYLGDEEFQSASAPELRRQAKRMAVPLSVEVVPGDHETSVPIAMQRFLRELSARAEAAQ